MDTENDKPERTIRIQEAWVDTLFISLLAGMFYANCDSSGIAISFVLALALAAGIVLYRGYSFESDQDEYEAT